VLLGLSLARIRRPFAPLLFTAFAALSGLDAAARAARRAPPTWRPLNRLACDASSGPARLHLTPLTYLPARRYRPADCAAEDRVLWDPNAGPGYVLDYTRRGEMLPADVLTAYPDGLCPLTSFQVVSDPAQAGRGREGLLLTRLRSNPSFVRTESEEVGAVTLERFDARCGQTTMPAENR
jgi:hypothetical protein